MSLFTEQFSITDEVTNEIMHKFHKKIKIQKLLIYLKLLNLQFG